MEVLRFKKLFREYRRLTLIPVSIGMLLTHNNIFAASTTSNFAVTSTVTASCTIISASTLGFGNYTLALIEVNSSIIVQCTNGTPYSITLNAGTGGGGVNDRKMSATINGTVQTLPYFLFKDAAKQQNWGNNTTGTTDTGLLSQTGTGAQVTHTVYGRIPAGQTSPIGSYTDTIQITVTY